MGLRCNRWVALFAAFALITCSAVYAAHDIGDRAHGHSHCDLCAHFSGSAGSPAQAKVAGKPVLVVRAVRAAPTTYFIARSPVGAHLPRGPPLLPAI